MKAQSTRAGGRHAAQERGAYDSEDVQEMVPYTPREQATTLFCRLSERSILALAVSVRRCGLELKAE